MEPRILATEIAELQVVLPEMAIEIGITGFDRGEIDTLTIDFGGQCNNPADEIPQLGDSVIACAGDLFLLGKHRLLVGDARDDNCYVRLTGSEKAEIDQRRVHWDGRPPAGDHASVFHHRCFDANLSSPREGGKVLAKDLGARPTRPKPLAGASYLQRGHLTNDEPRRTIPLRRDPFVERMAGHRSPRCLLVALTRRMPWRTLDTTSAAILDRGANTPLRPR
jgi:hypothetical protein